MRKRSRKLKEVQQNVLQLDFFSLFAKGLNAVLEKKEKEEAKKSTKVVDLSNYNLVYKRKSDDRKFLVRAITKMDYSVIDTVTGKEEKMTQAKLKSRMKPVKEVNKRNKKRPLYLSYARKKAS